MGLLTYRQTKKTKNEVRGLRRDLSQRAAIDGNSVSIATDPSQLARLDVANERRTDIVSALVSYGFEFRRNLDGKTQADRRAMDCAYRYIVQDGMTILEAARRAFEDCSAATHRM